MEKNFLVATSIVVLYSCASVGNLGGGPYDETPPRFLSGSPSAGALNVDKRRFSMTFDEYIKLDKPGEKVVISPPQLQQPGVRANGKKVVVSLEDTLIKDATYTIDFSDAIQDNNEGNPLESFVYTFSTGDKLDTMAVSGIVLNARDLEPVKGMLVGLHTDLEDSAFLKKPFERVGRSDSRGHFSIKGIAPGKYHIYALQDADQNYFYSQPKEAVAFLDSIIVPAMEQRMKQDTVWADSLTIDSISEHEYTHYLPDDLLLRSFQRLRPSQRLAKSERTTKKDFTLSFTAPADTLPTIKGLNFDERDAFVVDRQTERIDTIKYWIKDSLIYNIDTLRFSVSYLYTDSLKQLSPRTDTLKLVSKERPKSQKELEVERKAKEKENRKKRERGEQVDTVKVEHLSVNVYAPTSLDVYDYLSLSFNEPVADIDTTALHVKVMVDSIWQDAPFELVPDTFDIKAFNIYASWNPGDNYMLEVDSAAIRGLYGLTTDKIQRKFSVKTLDSYGQVFFNIQGADSTAFVELLDAKDVPVRSVPVVNGRADFYYLTPGKYGARLIVDSNGNGVWDAGDYEKHIQPEEVFYYPQMIEFKANFDLLQDWGINSLPPDKQKPEEMKKQKPDKKKERRRRDEKNNNNRRNNNSMGGMGGMRGFGM